jgi:hypothetical protein
MMRMGVTIDSWINQNVPEASIVIVRGDEIEVLSPKEAKEKYYDVVPKKVSEFEHMLPSHKFAVCKLIFEL